MKKLLPYFALLLWTVPLLLLGSDQSSLMPQDEAMYSVRARWMVESGDWLTPQSWGELVYEKTPGTYWLIAFCYKLFGVSDIASRLPAQLACILSTFLTYKIAVILLKREQIARFAAAILSVSYLWLQGSRLATANISMISMGLLGIWCLLHANQSRYFSRWCFAAGLSFGLGFLIRGQMIFLPMTALLPYLILSPHRRHPLANPMLYLGLVVGLMPTILWFWLSWAKYGNVVFEQFFNLVKRIASEQRNGNSPLFYLWNTPLKAFPWPFFSILGLIPVWRKSASRLILIGCPLVILAEISCVATRLPHYALMLYPFMAMLAAVGLDWLGMIYERGTKHKYLVVCLSYGFGGLGCLLFLGGMGLEFAPLFNLKEYIYLQKYGMSGILLGLGWLTLPLMWIFRQRGNKLFTAKYWVASWLVSAWLGLAAIAATGLFSDFNPDVKVFFRERAIASTVQHQAINFVVQETQSLTTGGDPDLLLLTFYTPHWGQRFRQVSELPAKGYAWVSPESSVWSAAEYRHLGTFHGWKLIQSK